MAEPDRPLWKGDAEQPRSYVFPALVAALIVGVAGWLLIRNVRASSAAGSTEVDAAVMEEKRMRLLKQADEFEAVYRRLETEKAGPERLEVALTRAIDKRRELLVAWPAAGVDDPTRLARLEKARAELRSRLAALRSAALESEAETARRAGQMVVAKEKFQEALRLQELLNAPTSDAPADRPRAARLQAALAQLEIEPLRAAVKDARAKAVAAANRRDSVAALAGYDEVKAALTKLKERFPESPEANAAAFEAVDLEVASIHASEIATKVSAAEREGDVAGAAGRATDAADAYRRAADLQRELNATYPRARFVSTARIDQLLIREQTVRSRDAMNQAQELARQASALLATGRNDDASVKVTEASELIRRTITTYPRSRAIDRGLALKLSYLIMKRDDIGSLQARVQADLLPIPGSSGRKLARTEVTQELFERVMNTNPSRSVGRTLPVDSVTWSAAREFCQRMTWITGMTVRLPTEDEFRAAVAAGANDGWTAESSGAHTHAVGQLDANPAGFHDLLGNVAEWLEPRDAKGATAPIAGGGFLDLVRTPSEPMVSHADCRDANRQIGFRYVVEMVEQQAVK
jgi:tetratricopeptide (TPR) repeat protein